MNERGRWPRRIELRVAPSRNRWRNTTPLGFSGSNFRAGAIVAFGSALSDCMATAAAGGAELLRLRGLSKDLKCQLKEGRVKRKAQARRNARACQRKSAVALSLLALMGLQSRNGEEVLALVWMTTQQRAEPRM